MRAGVQFLVGNSESSLLARPGPLTLIGIGMQHLGKQVSQRFWKSRKLRRLPERLSGKLYAGQKKIHCGAERIDLRTKTRRFVLSPRSSDGRLLRRRYLPIHFYFVSLEFACYTGRRSLARWRAFRACLEPGQTKVRQLH